MKRSRKGPWWLHVLALLIALGALRLGWFESRGCSDLPPKVSEPSGSGRSAEPSGPSGSAPSAPRTEERAPPRTEERAPRTEERAPPRTEERAPRTEERAPPAGGAEAVGFTSKRAWREHFAKHGAEFGKISAEEYLRLAQVLRDAPRSQLVLELVRDDGVITRFDRASGAFLAFHRDLSIRTFFRPRDGEAYFERQASR